MYSDKIQKPFLKWVGGKTQIITHVLDKFPSEMENYHDVFVGGGSVLLAVLSLQEQNKLVIKNKIFAYDYNRNLINTYKCIQTRKDELFQCITKYASEYDSITGDVVNRKPSNLDEAKLSKESYYYWSRDKFNSMDKDTVEFSALFIFLNKTCFRGVYREGPKGFNVPYGHYKKTPVMITKDVLDRTSTLIKDVVFLCSDFRDSIENIQNGDFVYLDPPYAPENKNSFVGYTSLGFSLEMHEILFSKIHLLHKNNVKFVMNNSNTALIRDNFKDYLIHDITARRAINSKNPGKTTTEVIICN